MPDGGKLLRSVPFWKARSGGAGAGLLRSVGMGAGELFHFWMTMQGVFGTVCAGFGAMLPGYIG